MNKQKLAKYWVEEFYDLVDVLEMGAKKHGNLNWLDPNGSKASHKDMHDSMFHHLAESFVGETKDDESGLHPLLHLACRAMMVYTRNKRNIYHKDDFKTIENVEAIHDLCKENK